MEDNNFLFEKLLNHTSHKIISGAYEDGFIEAHIPKFSQNQEIKNFRTVKFPKIHLYLLSDTYETENSEVRRIKYITLYFPKYEDFIYNYYHFEKYKDVNKYKDDFIKILEIFHGYNIFNDMKQCILSYEKKFENGGNFKPEIDFIKEQLKNDEPINQEAKEYIKQIDFEKYKSIMEKLPNDLKKKWFLTFDHEDRIQVLNLINFKELNQEELKQMLEIIFKDQKQAISDNLASNLKEMEWEFFCDLGIDDQLIEASKRGYLGPVGKLMAHGAKINPQDKKINNTALMEASENGHQDVVKFLLENGATINRKNSDKIKKDMEKLH